MYTLQQCFECTCLCLCACIFIVLSLQHILDKSKHTGILNTSQFDSYNIMLYVPIHLSLSLLPPFPSSYWPLPSRACSRTWTDSLNAIPFICFGFQVYIMYVYGHWAHNVLTTFTGFVNIIVCSAMCRQYQSMLV